MTRRCGCHTKRSTSRCSFRAAVSYAASCTALRDRLIAGVLERIPHTSLNGHPTQRLPNNANIAFESLRCKRLTALTKHHSRMDWMMDRLGFEQEGCLRRYYSDDSDAIVWGMLKEECPWF